MTRTKGAHLLARTGKSQQAIAADCGTSDVAVHYWLSGEKKPGRANRTKLLALYGVPEEAWDEPQRRGSPAPPQAARAAPTGDAAAVGGAFAMARELEDMAREQIASLRQDTTSTPHERARVMSSIATTISTLAKLTGDYDLGRRLTKTPTWRRLEVELGAVLRPYPAAAQAVADRFAALDAESG